MNVYLSSDVEGITLVCEERILSALKDNPKGLGVRELKRRTSEKCVRLWLPKLQHWGYVKYKNPDAKRGQKKIVMITEKGVTRGRVLREIEKIEREFMEEFGVPSVEDDVNILGFEKKLDLYEKLLMDIFDVCLKADSKFAVRFLNTTLVVVRKLSDKKLYDLETHKLIVETIQKALG